MSMQQVRRIERIVTDQTLTFAIRKARAMAILDLLTDEDEQIMGKFYIGELAMGAAGLDEVLEAARADEV
jgi:hypothetical protein